jgi:hypothetical protein
VFADGDDEVMSGLTDWVRREKITGAHLCALGAFSTAKFAWFDKDKRAYRDIPSKRAGRMRVADRRCRAGERSSRPSMCMAASLVRTTPSEEVISSKRPSSRRLSFSSPNLRFR